MRAEGGELQTLTKHFDLRLAVPGEVTKERCGLAILGSVRLDQEVEKSATPIAESGDESIGLRAGPEVLGSPARIRRGGRRLEDAIVRLWR